MTQLHNIWPNPPITAYHKTESLKDILIHSHQTKPRHLLHKPHINKITNTYSSLFQPRITILHSASIISPHNHNQHYQNRNPTTTHTPRLENFHITIWILSTILSILRIDFINTVLVPYGAGTNPILYTYRYTPRIASSNWICIHNFVYIHPQLP